MKSIRQFAIQRAISVGVLCLVILSGCGGGGGGYAGGNPSPPPPTPNPQDRLLNGHYAFLFSGFFHGYFTGAGSFVADGTGNISSGIVDTNGLGGPTIDGSFTGTYTLGANNAGTMTLNYGSGAIVTYAIAVSSNGDARFIQYEASGVEGSGVIKKQDSSAFATSKVTGAFAFGLSGLNGPTAKRLALVGAFQADGVSALTGVADGNNNGSLLSNETLSASYAVATSGRGTATVNVTGLGTLSTVFYVVSANELLMMEVDPVNAGNPLLSGDVLKQAGGSFSAASLNGTGIIQAIGLLNSPSAMSTARVAFATATTPGTLAINADVNTGGTLSTQNESLSYSVMAGGRVTTTGSSDAPVLYLIATNQGFTLFSDSAVTFGTLEAQATGSFANSSVSGSYLGGSATLTTPGTVEADSLNADGGGNLIEAYSSSDGTNLLQGNRTLTYVTAASGRAMLSAQGSGAGFLYVVSPSKVIVLGAGAPALSTLEQ